MAPPSLEVPPLLLDPPFGSVERHSRAEEEADGTGNQTPLVFVCFLFSKATQVRTLDEAKQPDPLDLEGTSSSSGGFAHQESTLSSHSSGSS